ncbi:MAG: NTP transferase domain-containing protein [Deltaproteobacteria bacterium]|jgi:bifunctional UDP-N-acetylglucosamine pyrophosphorylase/glucosamine-1-phosphate N-acetyltransferase|nr:NTP transferase domain-containing protein [Deltaproteobacteria bacterium]
MVEAKSSGSAKLAVVVLAAGQGTRMKSTLPKVLHQIMGKPMLAHVLNAARYLEPDPLVVVTGHEAAKVEAAVEEFSPLFVHQEQRLGTGHAVAQAKSVLAEHLGQVVIIPGDVPLISPQTLLDFIDAHRALRADLSALSVRVEWPNAYGRIIRDQSGWLERIVEARDATEAELAINEVNSGIYACDAPKLFEAISRLNTDNDQKEYYLTDVAALFRAQGWSAAAIEAPDPTELQGINDRRELALVQSLLRERINLSWLMAGVTMEDPSTAHIEASVRLSSDVTLGQGVILKGSTSIATGAVIGPYCCLKDTIVGVNAQLAANLTLSGANICDNAEVWSQNSPEIREIAKTAKAAEGEVISDTTDMAEKA